MNAELMLKLQSWVDGELPEAEARQVVELVRTDKEAAALAAELKMTSGFLAGNEPEAKLAESREFYWSKIERAIERAGAGEPEGEAVSWLLALRRLLVPVSGFALVAFLTVASIGVFNRNSATVTTDEPGRFVVQEENLSKHVETVSYKARSENMFVVYVINKEDAADEDDFDLDSEEEMDDAVIQ